LIQEILSQSEENHPFPRLGNAEVHGIHQPGRNLLFGGLKFAHDLGKIFRCVARTGRVWGSSITEKAVWHIVKKHAASLGIPKLAPHDLRRSCARFCHAAGGELEQIQFLLGHVSVQTTERYVGCKQRLWGAVNDRIGIEPLLFLSEPLNNKNLQCCSPITQDNMKNLFLCALIAVSFLQGCCGSSLNGEEARVYAAYVDAHFTKVADSTEPLKKHVICDTTAGFQIHSSWEKEIAKLTIKPQHDTAVSFVSRNGGTPRTELTDQDRKVRGRYPMNPQLSFKLPHVLIQDSLIQRLFFTDGGERWSGFNARFPKSHGIIWLSRVGFNTAMSEALVYVGNEWSDGAGEGFLVLLRKVGDHWAEATRVACWIS
jgi:hypothetical protein